MQGQRAVTGDKGQVTGKVGLESQVSSDPRPTTCDLRPPLVSVIMPTHNGERTIEAAMQSVLAQEFRDLELIVVDDSSSDGTAAIVQRIQANDPRVLYIYQHPRLGGPGPSRNRALREARGKYVAFLDGDDVWLLGKLEQQVSWLEAHPETVLCFTQMYRDADSEERMVCPSSDTRYNYLAEFRGNLIPVLTVVMRRDCLEAVGGFSEDLGMSEDYDLWLRLGQRYAFHFLSEPTAIYTVHETSMSRNAVRMRRAWLKALRRVPINRRLGVTPWQKRRRLAQVRYDLARALYERGACAEGAWECVKTVTMDPGVGGSVWNERESKIWRRFQPYRLLAQCLVGMVFGREKADVKWRS